MSQPVDQAARLAAATDLARTFFVEAAAGTGKTTALVARILAAVTSGRARLDQVVAITFTEKAAGELKMRVRSELEKQLADGALAAALADLERASITTIHSFCASLLRERPIEAAVDPQFVVADALQQDLLLEESWRQWLEAELDARTGPLRQALLREIDLDSLESLGRLLVHNRDWLATVSLPAVLPLDIESVVARLRALAPALEAVTAQAVEPNANFARRARLLLDTLAQLDTAGPERKVALLCALELKGPKAKAEFDSPAGFAEAKRLTKEIGPLLAEFAEAADHNLLAELVEWLGDFVGAWQAFKRQRAVLDFDDLLAKTRDLLANHAEVRAELQRRYKFLLVDEFQDTDPVQVQIVELLAGDSPGKLFIVGDPKQSIYAFRRADIEMYAATRQRVLTGGTGLVFQQNFRSQSTILDWVNATFAKILVRSNDGDYQPEYIPLTPCAKFQTDQPTVTLLRPAEWPEKESIEQTRRAEAIGVAEYLRGLIGTGAFQWRDVALLFRSFTAVEIYTEVFQAAGVPFRVIGGRGYYQRQEIQTLIALLCCLDNPADKLSLVATLRSPLFGWTDEELFLASAQDRLDYLAENSPGLSAAQQSALALLRQLHRLRHGLSVAAFVELVLARTHFHQAFFSTSRPGDEAVANLLKALELARALESAGVRSLRALVRRLRVTIVNGLEEEPAPANEESDDAVQLLTMHKSKGLQFPVVVLADLAGRSVDNGPRLLRERTSGQLEVRFASGKTNGFEQAQKEQNKREEAEEIRLLYVAATRAEKRLVLPWFRETGERLELIQRGFDPVAGPLVDLVTAATALTPAVEAPAAGSRDAAKLMAARRAWQTEREQLLARIGAPVARVSPSKLGGESEPATEESVGLARAAAMELGTAVHAGLERMSAAGLEGRARELVESALGSPLLQRVRAADEAHREVPFTVRQADGALLEGKIDLLFRERDHWVLVDWKTDSRPDPEKYRAQMQAYVAALRQIAGIAVGEVLLFYVSTNQEVRLA